MYLFLALLCIWELSQPILKKEREGKSKRKMEEKDPVKIEKRGKKKKEKFDFIK
jgi:hypothetical protein